MSSPIRHAKDVDPTLVYAPRWAREQTQQVSTLPAAPQIELPARSFSDARQMLERQLALNPDSVPEPPQLVSNDRPMGRIALLISSVVAVAAGVAWAITWMPDASGLRRETVRTSFPAAPLSDAPVATRSEQPNRQVDVAAPEPKSTQEPASSHGSEPASFSAATIIQPPLAQVPVPAHVVATREPTPQQTVSDLIRQRRIADQRAMPEPKSTQEPGSSPDRSEPASFAATMTQPPPAQVPVPAPAVVTREPTPQQMVPDFVTRYLDADELASMLRRADDLIMSGDLSSARLLLRRVAEAGDARAAFTLAGTFDPNVLKALGLQDGAPDIALARLWYERAARLGSADAPRRLQQLATASAQ